MEVIYEIIKDYGWTSAGWIVAVIAVYLLAKNYNGVLKQLKTNVGVLTDAVIELKTMVKVQQEQIHNQNKDSENLREDVHFIKEKVLTVNYKRT